MNNSLALNNSFSFECIMCQVRTEETIMLLYMIYDKDARSNLISNLVLSFNLLLRCENQEVRSEQEINIVDQLIGYRRSLSSLSTSPRRLPLSGRDTTQQPLPVNRK